MPNNSASKLTKIKMTDWNGEIIQHSRFQQLIKQQK